MAGKRTKAASKAKPADRQAEGVTGSTIVARRKSGSQALVVVESPAKAKTINKYLGSSYIVKASMGHVRDLPARGLAVDIENGFSPTYELVAGRRKVVGDLRKLADKAETVYLATDLDREGEAIAWHLAQSLGIEESKARRVVFNEITRTAIQEAFMHPRGIDMDKVNAQQARRILDRIVGYELSPLLWKKIAKGLSAGRVQSVAVRMVVEREKEIRDFIPSEYWTINAYFGMSPAEAERLAPAWRQFLSEKGENGSDKTQKEITAWLSGNRSIRASLTAVKGGAFKPEAVPVIEEGKEPQFVSAAGEAQRVAEALGFSVAERREDNYQEYAHRGLKTVQLIGALDRNRLPEFRVADIQTKRTRTRPSPPFTTATLQQAAGSHLHMAPSRTMKLAQQLYEGIELPGEDGPVALITYMRTDSTNLSAESLAASREWVKAHCGEKYLPDKPNVYGSGKRAQEAHEAVRPTDVARTPESLKNQLSGGLFKLYELIWKRFVACQMQPAEWDSTTITIQAPTPAGEAEFKATGRTLVFDGFYKVLGVPKSSDEQLLPPIEVGQQLGALDITPEQHFTAPPPRYTESSLVKRLEAEGIGRPSTYAAIIQTVQDRGYVEQRDRRLYATDKGMIVTEKLMEHFPDVMDYRFTSFMEDELDKIEDAHLDWVKVLHEFYDPFHRDLVRAHTEMEAARTEPSEYTCELCGKPMVYRWGKIGRFLSCSGYPECKGAHNVDNQGRPVRPQKTEHICERCGREMMLRQSRHGTFLGCSGYPECSNTVACDDAGAPLKLVTDKEIEEPCESCGEGTLQVKRRGVRAFLGCNRYPKCKFTKPIPPGVRVERKVAPVEEAGVNCERCGRPMHIKSGRRGKFIACSGFPKCRNAKPIEKLDELKAQAATNGKVSNTGQNGGSSAADHGDAAGGAQAKARSGGGGNGSIADLGPPPAGFAWTRTGKPVVEKWPEDELHCPNCGTPMTLKNGRFGPFFSCSNYPRCKTSVNLRGEAKKRAEADMPQPPKAAPVPTNIPCDDCGSPMVIRTGRSGRFLGCSNYPKCKCAKPLPVELMSSAGKGG